MISKISFFILALCFSTAAVADTDLFSGKWGYPQIIQLIENQKAQKKPIKSIDELIHLLPTQLKENFTFVYKTKTILQAASPMYPRALGFNGRMIYSFNGHPQQVGYNSIEVMDFNPTANKFELGEITTHKNNAGADEVSYSPPHQTPEKCIACHGVDPKPIWNEYSSWPGVYGSEDDTPPADEKKSYLDFRDNLSQNPTLRYNELIFRKGSKVSPYQETDNDDFRFRVNLIFSQTLIRDNALRIARMMEESPNFSTLHDIALFLLARDVLGTDCEKNAPGFDSTGNEISMRLTDEVARMGITPQLHYHSPTEHVLALLGIFLDTYSLSRDKPSFYFSDGPSNQEELVLAALYEDLTKNETDLNGIYTFEKKFLKDGYGANPLYVFNDSVLAPIDDDEQSPQACSKLLEHARMAASQKWSLQQPQQNDNFANNLKNYVGTLAGN